MDNLAPHPGDNFPADNFDAPDEPWFIEPKDKDPRDEHKRQVAVVAFLRKQGLIVYAVDNGGRMSAGLKLWKWRQGVTAGALDLEVKWPLGRSAVIEMKDGRGMPTREQRGMLNDLYRAGVPCAVCRTPGGVAAFLRSVGCPISGDPIGRGWTE